MADRAQLMQGMRAAHDAGDANAARRIAGMIKNLPPEAEAPAAAEPWQHPMMSAADAKFPETLAEFSADPAVRALTGAGDILHGPLRLGAYVGDKATEAFGGEPMLGDWLDKNRAQLKDMQTRGGHEGFDMAGLAGAMASGAGAISQLPTVASKIPAAAQLGKFLAPVEKGAGTVAKMVQGGKIGGFYGLTAPATDDGDLGYAGTKVAQTGGGALLGGLIPGAIEGGKKIGSVAKDIWNTRTSAGHMRLAKEYINSLVGDSRDKIVDALARTQAKAHTAVPGGSKATGGQAIAEANIGAGERFGGPLVKLESMLGKAPETTTPIRSAQVAQEDARKGIIEAIAKTPKAKATATAARKAVTDPLYKQVDEAIDPVDIAPVKALLKDVLSKNRNESGVVKPLKEILDKLDDNSPQGLTSLSRELKEMMAKKTVSGQSEFNVGALTKIKQSLDEQIGKTVPAYTAAREATKELSKPINRMDVGEVLKDKLSSVKDRETALQYLKALDDVPKTFKQATGFPRYKELEQVLDPIEATGARKVGQELLRDNMAQRMASEVNLPGALTQEASGTAQLPNALWRPAMIANYALKNLGADANQPVNKAVARIMADPAKLQKVLTLPEGNPQKEMVQALINRLMTQQAPVQAHGLTEGGE